MSNETNLVPAETKYILPSDEGERERLDVQHGLLKNLFGGLLPSGYNPSDDDEILDSGTGTGIWLLDVASTSPATVRFTGIDVSTALYPVQHPANLTFIRQSALDLPLSWSSRFTYIHQRLLTAAFGLPEWKIALAFFFRDLQPGGWLRLEEFSPRFVPPLDEATTPKSLRVLAVMAPLGKKRELMLNSRELLPGLMEDAGFVDVEVEDFVLKMGPGIEHERARMNIVTVFRTVVPALAALGVSAEEVNELIDGFHDEMATHDIGMLYHTFTARKPPVS